MSPLTKEQNKGYQALACAIAAQAIEDAYYLLLQGAITPDGSFIKPIHKTNQSWGERSIKELLNFLKGPTFPKLLDWVGYGHVQVFPLKH